MFSLLSNIMTGYLTASSYKSQAKVAGIQAQSLRTQANAQADAIERTAARNKRLSDANLRAARTNQSRQLGRIRAAESGFSDAGTGNQAYLNAQATFDREIANMALSASVDSHNALQSAIDTRHKGELSAMTKEIEANQLRLAAKAVQSGTIVNAVMGGIGAFRGWGIGEESAQTFNDKLDEAVAANIIKQEDADLLYQDEAEHAFAASSHYGSGYFNATSAFNSFTTGMTKKQNWGSYLSLSRGRTPGFQHSKNSLF